MTFPITSAQRAFLDSLDCERFSASSENRALIDAFRNERGKLIIQAARDFGFTKDATKETAYYVVKNKSGLALMFFSLQCGELFSPLVSADEYLRMAAYAVQIRQAIDNAKVGGEKRKKLKKYLDEITCKKRSWKYNVKLLIRKLLGQKFKSWCRLTMDMQKEKNKKVTRVQKTYSGVLLELFCANDLAREYWKGFNASAKRSMCEILFWEFIVKKFIEIRDVVGCEYAFLFAADGSDDNDLMRYYRDKLQFGTNDDVGANKPSYDWLCGFMCQRLVDIAERRQKFFDEINDPLPSDDFM